MTFLLPPGIKRLKGYIVLIDCRSGFKKQLTQLKLLAVASVSGVAIRDMLTCWVSDQIDGKMSNSSDVTR